ncbi:MAG: class I SAM-dependent methyltransferase [Candidatus Diapherotrites archaeon]|nr:class I SAM-dependent methyltransferase [Candidatus Diapherotrites archaeon]
MTSLGKIDKQTIQEEEYALPYHYEDLFSEEKALRAIEYLDYLHLVRDELSPLHGKKVLDIGCGDGRFIYELRGKGSNLAGIDLSERAIAFARAFNPHVFFHVGSLKQFPDRKKWDAITLIEVLEHIPPSHVNSFLTEVVSRIHPGGKLIVTVPSVKRELVAKHYCHFTESTLIDLLKPHVEIVKVIGYGKKDLNRMVFETGRRLILLLHPFRHRVPFLRGARIGLIRFYRDRIGVGPTNVCTGMLAVGIKR